MNIQRVAKEAGVSITTVSRVMNNPEAVSETTRKKVLSVIEGLNYTPNWFARNLQNKRTNVIGVFIPDTLEQSCMELVKGIEKVARKKGCNIVICNTNYNEAEERKNVENLAAGKIDGLILISSSLKKEDLRQLEKKKVPVVLTDRTDLQKSHSVVSTDYREATKSAIEHFLEMGRRKIAMIVSKDAKFIGEYKKEGYFDAIKESCYDIQYVNVIEAEDSIKGGLIAAGKLLEQNCRPDAIFAATDTMAFGVLERIRQADLTVEDIGVIGYDGLETGAITEPKLTTVAKPSYRMGLTAARLLFDKIKDKEEEQEYSPESVVLQSRLKIRKSCGNKERLREIW